MKNYSTYKELKQKKGIIFPVNPLYTGKPLMGTFANSEDPDEMQHDAAFHQGLHSLLCLKQPSGMESHHNSENSSVDP